MMEGEGKKKNPMREEGVKYIIYLHWQRETNAFTEIEDTSPSHIDTYTHTHIHLYIYTHTHTHFGLKNTGWETEGRETVISFSFFFQSGRGAERESAAKKRRRRRKKGAKQWVERIEEWVERPK